MTNGKTEFPGVTIDASAPVCMDWVTFRLDPSMDMQIGRPASEGHITFITPARKEVMRISKDGVWVDPDMPTDEAAKAVIAAMDSHIKGLMAERDAVLRMALEELTYAHAGYDCREALRKVLGG